PSSSSMSSGYRQSSNRSLSLPNASTRTPPTPPGHPPATRLTSNAGRRSPRRVAREGDSPATHAGNGPWDGTMPRYQPPTRPGGAVQGRRVTSGQTTEAMAGRAAPDRIRVDGGRRLDRTAACGRLGGAQAGASGPVAEFRNRFPRRGAPPATPTPFVAKGAWP